MSNIVEVSPKFKRDIKPLVKKYHTLKQSVEDLQRQLIENPYLGDAYGNGVYKVRLGDESKGTGKSGGFRILYYHIERTKDGVVMLLLNIYDKSELGSITKREILKNIDDIVKEFRWKQ